MNRRRAIVLLSGLAVVGLIGLGGILLTQWRTERAHCPGKIVCPLTGQMICRDKCPTVDSSRPDCPGRVVCPLTGKLVCRDRCPLKIKGDVKAAGKTRPCCAGRTHSSG